MNRKDTTVSTVTQRPFRFGVVAAHIQSRADWVSRAHKVEALGYDTLLVVDHLTTSLGPLVALTVAAEATTRIRIGSFVFCNDFRHPAILAKEVATLDMLSEGRFEFGLGAGYQPTDYHLSGLPMDGAGVRISRFEEAIHLLKKLFLEEAVTFHGDYYTTTELQGLPKPTQKPHPPIIMGKVLAGFITTLLMGGSILVVSDLFGLVYPVGIYWLNALVTIALIALIGSGIGVALGARLQRPQPVIGLGINIALYLFLCAGGIGVLAFMTDWLQNIAAFVPLTYGRHALEMAVFYDSSALFGRDALILGVCALAAVGLGTLAVQREITN